jgi:hypothetical protein
MGVAAAGLLMATIHLSADSGVTAHIPFAFMASGKSLPAGDYRIEPLGPEAVLIAGSESSERAVLLVSSSASGASSPGASSPGITFDRSGALPQLTGVQTSKGTWQFITPADSKPGPPAAVALRSKK